MAEISIKIDGDLLIDKNPTLRTLAIVTTNLQAALSRAYLETRYGYVRKYQKNSYNDLANFDFVLSSVRKGSWIGDLISASRFSDAIAQKISEVISPIYELCGTKIDKYLYESTEIYDHDGGIMYKSAVNNPPKDISIGYQNKSIASYIDKSLSPLRLREILDAELQYTFAFNGDKRIFTFNRNKAFEFKKHTSSKYYYVQVIYRAKIVEMDEIKNTAFFINLDSDIAYRQRLLFDDKTSFDEARKYFGINEFSFIGRPVIECGSLDIYCGDVLFCRINK